MLNEDERTMSDDNDKKKKKQLAKKIKEEIASELGFEDIIANKVGLILHRGKPEKLEVMWQKG